MPADFTGARKKKLQDQHERELADREKELAMMSASRKREKDESVVDYSSDKPVPPPAGPVDYSSDNYEDDPTIAQILAESEEMPDPAKVGEAADPSVGAQTIKLEKTTVIIRAREDMNAVTVGKGTRFDFEAGRKYKVPKHVGEHLVEREVADLVG